MRITSASLLVFVLLGCSALLIPKQVLSENVSIKPVQRITLLNRLSTADDDNYEKASVSFRPFSYDAVSGPSNDRDLLYGSFNFKGDKDWFIVALVTNDRSRIQDVGSLDWSDDIAIPVLPILPCARNDSCNPIQIPSSLSGKTILDVNPHMAKPVAGHMYVVHTHDGERNLLDRSNFDTQWDFYTLFRVEELKPNESCTITWKRIPSPEK